MKKTVIFYTQNSGWVPLQILNIFYFQRVWWIRLTLKTNIELSSKINEDISQNCFSLSLHLISCNSHTQEDWSSQHSNGLAPLHSAIRIRAVVTHTSWMQISQQLHKSNFLPSWKFMEPVTKIRKLICVSQVYVE